MTRPLPFRGGDAPISRLLTRDFCPANENLLQLDESRQVENDSSCIFYFALRSLVLGESLALDAVQQVFRHPLIINAKRNAIAL